MSRGQRRKKKNGTGIRVRIVHSKRIFFAQISNVTIWLTCTYSLQQTWRIFEHFSWPRTKSKICPSSDLQVSNVINVTTSSDYHFFHLWENNHLSKTFIDVLPSEIYTHLLPFSPFPFGAWNSRPILLLAMIWTSVQEWARFAQKGEISGHLWVDSVFLLYGSKTCFGLI